VPITVLTLPESLQTPLSVRAKAVVFEDPVSRELLARLRRIAPSEASVLITGETGTGKEIVAREIHALSRRADRPFVAVNAGAFSETLIESELFGHERGAFTGAHERKAGWFEAANGGTLFLDEIGDLPLSLQVKLLRVLQEGEVTRVGARTPTAVNVRLIAATNVDLPAAIRARLFREDLYYRLSVASLRLPPLRERRGDIAPLARYFAELYQRRLGRSGLEIGRLALEQLLAHGWPGNIRELENAIHHALLVCQSSEIGPEDLPFATPPVRTEAGCEFGGALGLPEVDSGRSALGELERALGQLCEQGISNLHRRVESLLFSTCYRHAGRNQLETARLLGLSRHVVRARLIDAGELQGPLRRSHGGSRWPAAGGRRGHDGDGSPPSERRIQRSVRIGCQKLGLLMMLKASGTFDAALAEQGVAVEWLEYGGGIQIVEALGTGALDLGVVGDCPAVVAQAGEEPIVYFAAEPPAPKGTALIVPEGSTLLSVADLRGRRVVVNRAAQAHYLLIKALEEAGVTASELEIQFEPPERALKAFRSGTVDAWAIWDPWLSSARLDLGARVLRDASGLLESSAYYLARREFAVDRPQVVRELLAQLQATARRVERNPLLAAELAAPGLGFSSQALVQSLDRALSTVPLTARQIAAQQDIADTLLRWRLIPRAVSVADAQWPLRLAG
jgi:aliphatic sulfonates family ABC transporter substrate-binding protein